MSSADSPSSPGTLFVVELEGRARAVDKALVRETVPLPVLTPVPGAPPLIAGLAQVRGRIVTVLALEHTQPLPSTGGAGAGAAASAPRGALVLVESDGLRAGIRVDRLRDDALADPSPGGRSPEPRWMDLAGLLRALRDGGDGAGHHRTTRPPPHQRTPRSDEGGSGWALLGDDLGMLRDLFLDEASAHLEAAERAVARLEAAPGDRDAHGELLRRLHTLKGSAGAVGLDGIVQLAHHLEDRALELRAEAPASAWGAMAAEIERLRVEVARGGLGPSSEERRAAGGEAYPGGDGSPTTPAPTVEEAAHVRVAVEQIDALMEAATSLVQDRARIARRLPDLEVAGRDLERAAAALERGTFDGDELRLAAGAVAEARHRVAATITSLGADVESLIATSQIFQHGLRSMRMTEAGRLFARLAGSARDLARRLDRTVELRTVGGGTFVDKAVAERLADPLLHLLRNALVHGIEPPAVRAASGKPEAGHLELSARQRGDEILVEIADDGAGVDVAAVRRALVRAGLRGEHDASTLPDPLVVDAIFEPGVSTRDGAFDLAGRGVGLDAVKAAIARLGGSISCTSRPGQGTRFTVRLPLTAAVVHALLFKAAGQVYAVPATSVVRVLSSDTTTALPRVDLPSLLGSGPGRGAGHQVLLDHEGTRFAATVDRVIGEREIVVKGLGPLLAGLPLYAGATISGAGKVQLLLDVAELCARRAAVPAAAVADRAAPHTGAAPAAARVLVVDDSPTARAALCAALRGAGHEVEEALDGASAIERLTDGSAALPALLVTDLEMPRLDGFALLERLRTLPALSLLPVVVVSSRGAAARDRALSLGAAAFLDKPAAPDTFLATVSALLHRSNP